jgi:hypothetical protein
MDIATPAVPAPHHRFLVVISRCEAEGPSAGYRVCSMEAGAWIKQPFDQARYNRGVRRTEEQPPDCVMAGLVAVGDAVAGEPYHLEVSADTPENDRARVVHGEAQFTSVLALFQYLALHGLVIVDEFSGLDY